jgi:hypothetical protein
VLAIAAVCACTAGAGRAAPGRDLSAYRGLATWVDLYDPAVWANPEREVAAMSSHGVRTLFLETSNYAWPADVNRPDRVARFVDAAHARGLRVVAWYVPSYRHLGLDLRRSLATLRFRTPAGGRFDSFALDVEGTLVHPASLRSARAVWLARQVRAAGAGMALGAIVPSPRGLQFHPHYWPGFPFAALSRSLDVFLPMGYFTYRPRYPGGSAAYTLTNIQLLRAATGNPRLPVHAIGGIAGNATTAQVRGFVEAARSGRTIGLSLYDFATTSAREWAELRSSR